jgi:hypothetical protein
VILLAVSEHSYAVHPSQSVEGSLTDEKCEVEKLKLQLSLEREERTAADKLLESTRDELGNVRQKLLREQIAHSVTALDCDQLHHTMRELSTSTNKSVDEFVLLQQLLNTSPTA